jgi:hypothetical protein
MLKYWKVWEDWLKKLKTPQRWLPGWMPEMIKAELEDDDWTVERWILKFDQ